MKRLTFKKEFADDVKAGRKRFTSRWKSQGLIAGDVVAAVTAKDGRPAFLVAARDRFATLLVVSREAKLWKDFTEADAEKCGVTKDWYLREKPDAHDHTPIFLYGFEPVTEVGR